MPQARNMRRREKSCFPPSSHVNWKLCPVCMASFIPFQIRSTTSALYKGAMTVK